ncbi:MAG: tyrosine-type recombinase/integrase [Agarilytica sp.]
MADLTLISNASIEDLKESLLKETVWSFEDLGYKNHEVVSSNVKTLNFRKYTVLWLVSLVKETLWRKRITVTPQTLNAYNSTLRIFDGYLNTLPSAVRNVKCLERRHMEGFLSHISDRSKQTQQSHITRLNEIFHCWQEWSIITAPATSLIHRGDAPRNVFQANPRYMEPTSQDKINSQLDIENNPLSRMVAVIQETGMRGTEVLHLKKNCLTQDSHGDWYLTRHNLKINEVHTIPISKKLYRIVQYQIEHVERVEQAAEKPNKDNLLFIHAWRGLLTHYSLKTLNRYLSEISELGRITDTDGGKQKITSHMFRHTVGTNLINNGMSQLFVQRFLGHKSAQMTAVYAHIHDRTLRKALESASQKLVDISGNVYEVEEVIHSITKQKNVDLDAQWLKSNISAQVLPNGLCALPVKQSCPHANACLTCPSFRTDVTFLDIHQEQLARSNSIVAMSSEKSFTRQAELNSTIAKNLTNIIEAIEHE